MAAEYAVARRPQFRFDGHEIVEDIGHLPHRPQAHLDLTADPLELPHQRGAAAGEHRVNILGTRGDGAKADREHRPLLRDQPAQDVAMGRQMAALRPDPVLSDRAYHRGYVAPGDELDRARVDACHRVIAARRAFNYGVDVFARRRRGLRSTSPSRPRPRT